MCTVTILPLENDDFVLTSNRDEAPDRVTLAPEYYQLNATKMLFPKDKTAGGTWIGVSEKKRLLCLLNGGFELHNRKEYYRLSRGVVVTDFLEVDDIVFAINTYDLDDVEPFTLVVVDWNSDLKLYELIWDGSEKHFKELPKIPRIWSSSTLYTDTMKDQRKTWFNQFQQNNSLTSDSLLYFHQTNHKENSDYGIVMDRNYVKTTSITQVKKVDGVLTMTFDDLQRDRKTSSEFLFPESINE